MNNDSNITTRRAQHNTNNRYFMFSRTTAQDREVSWESRGMLGYLLSKPDDWKLIPKDLQQQCGRGRVYRILNELIDARYIMRIYNRDTHGKVVGVVYIIHEEPFAENQDTDNQEMDNQDIENRHNTRDRELQETDSTKDNAANPGGASEPEQQEQEQALALLATGRHVIFQDGESTDYSRAITEFAKTNLRDLAVAMGLYARDGRGYDEVGEALRWIGRIEDTATSDERIAILREFYTHPHIYVRDGAHLGLAALGVYMPDPTEQEQRINFICKTCGVIPVYSDGYYFYSDGSYSCRQCPPQTENPIYYMTDSRPGEVRNILGGQFDAWQYARYTQEQEPEHEPGTQRNAERIARGYPPGYFERTAGCLEDNPIERGEQGEYEQRLPMDHPLFSEQTTDKCPDCGEYMIWQTVWSSLRWRWCGSCEAKHTVSNAWHGVAEQQEQSTHCPTCTHKYRTLLDDNNVGFRICNCTTEDDLLEKGFIPHEVWGTSGWVVHESIPMITIAPEHEPGTQRAFERHDSGYTVGEGVTPAFVAGRVFTNGNRTLEIIEVHPLDLQVDPMPRYKVKTGLVGSPDVGDIQWAKSVGNASLFHGQLVNFAKRHGLRRRKRSAPIDPFADKNDPTAPPASPLIPEEMLPPVLTFLTHHAQNIAQLIIADRPVRFAKALDLTALEELRKAGYVKWPVIRGDGQTYTLTDTGKALADNPLVKGAVDAAKRKADIVASGKAIGLTGTRGGKGTRTKGKFQVTSDHKPIFDELCNLFGVDTDLFGPGDWKFYAGEARNLFIAKASVEEVTAIYNWCKGKEWPKGFGPGALAKNLQQMRGEKKTATPEQNTTIIIDMSNMQESE